MFSSSPQQIGNLEDVYLFQARAEDTQRGTSSGTRVEHWRRSLLSEWEQMQADEHVRM